MKQLPLTHQYIAALYAITQQPSINYNEVYLNARQKYRYVRYTADINEHVEIAELSFYNSLHNNKIQAKVIAGSSPYNGNDQRIMDKINDGDYLSYALSQERGGCVIFDLGKPETLRKVVYIPRNDENFIGIGDTYELFFQNGAAGWISLGKKTAGESKLVYDNIPQNALLWLRNLSKGKEEQIFWIENGKQTFLEN